MSNESLAWNQVLRVDDNNPVPEGEQAELLNWYPEPFDELVSSNTLYERFNQYECECEQRNANSFWEKWTQTKNAKTEGSGSGEGDVGGEMDPSSSASMRKRKLGLCRRLVRMFKLGRRRKSTGALPNASSLTSISTQDGSARSEAGTETTRRSKRRWSRKTSDTTAGSIVSLDEGGTAASEATKTPKSRRKWFRRASDATKWQKVGSTTSLEKTGVQTAGEGGISTAPVRTRSPKHRRICSWENPYTNDEQGPQIRGAR